MQLAIKPDKEEFFTLEASQITLTLEEEFNTDDLFYLDFSMNSSLEEEEIGYGLDPSRKI